ncbi:hypothetical protein ES705_37995 [subsurface metagenome]
MIGWGFTEAGKREAADSELAHQVRTVCFCGAGYEDKAIHISCSEYFTIVSDNQTVFINAEFNFCCLGIICILPKLPKETIYIRSSLFTKPLCCPFSFSAILEVPFLPETSDTRKKSVSPLFTFVRLDIGINVINQIFQESVSCLLYL